MCDSSKYSVPISSTDCVNTTVYLRTYCSRFEYQLSEVMVGDIVDGYYYFAYDLCSTADSFSF